VKKTALSAYRHVRVTGINAINITDDDELIDVQITTGDDQVILATREGMAIRFHESDAREMGRATTGVRGIRLRKEDELIGMVVIRRENADRATLLVATEFGRGKRTAIDDYRYQARGGQGVINFRLNEHTGRVIAIKGVLPEDELMLITRNGVVTRQKIREIRVIGRNTQGVRLMALDEGDVLVDVARVVPEAEEDALTGVVADDGGSLEGPPDEVAIAAPPGSPFHDVGGPEDVDEPGELPDEDELSGADRSGAVGELPGEDELSGADRSGAVDELPEEEIADEEPRVEDDPDDEGRLGEGEEEDE
jgi:DNA gyrase subunit A